MSCLDYFNINSLESISISCSSLFQVVLCTFYNFFINSNGGAIYLTTSSNSIISQTVFFNCSSNNGGSFYILNSVLCSFSFNCFSNCDATSWGLAFYSSTSNYHHYYDNSIEFSSKFGLKGRSVALLYLGTQYFSYNNVSYCKANPYDAILLWHSISITINYNTVINNLVTIVINIDQSSKGNCTYSNFVNNNKNSNSHAFYYQSLSNIPFLFFQSLLILNNQYQLSYISNGYSFIECSFFNNSFLIPSGIINNLNSNTIYIQHNTKCFIKIFISPRKRYFNKLFIFLNLLY